MAKADIITIYRGQDIQLTFTMDPVENISGWSITFTVKTELGDSTAVIEKAAAIDDGPNGVFSVTLSDVDTNIASGGYVYDAWRTDAGGEVPLAVGQFAVLDSARKP